MDCVKIKGLDYIKFPRLDGGNDLFYRDGHVYRDDHGKLLCAWDTVRLDERGQQIKGKTGCSSAPGSNCCHIVPSSVYNIHHLFRGARIALSYLRLETGFVGLEKQVVLRVMRGLQELYCPNEKYEYDVFYLQQVNSIRYLRDHSNPGRGYGSTVCAMVTEEGRHPGFKSKIFEIRERVQSEVDWEPVSEEDRLMVIAQAVGDELSHLGYEFVEADVKIRRGDGTIETLLVRLE